MRAVVTDYAAGCVLLLVAMSHKSQVISLGLTFDKNGAKLKPSFLLICEANVVLW